MSLPDIDIDFCERRRGEVIDYVTAQVRRAQVAQIITFGTMRPGGRARRRPRHGRPVRGRRQVAKAMPAALDMTLEKALNESPALNEMDEKDAARQELLGVARASRRRDPPRLGPRRGRRIAPRPLTEFVPLYKSPKDEIVTQWR